jgi:hypothetical protein
MMSDCRPVCVGFLPESRPIRRGFCAKIPAIRAVHIQWACKSLEGYKLQVKKIIALFIRGRYNE